METNNEYNTKVTNKEIANGVKDEYGCIYSPDGKRLLKGNDDIESYTIKEGTEVICDKAWYFWRGRRSLQSIVIPVSVTKIGDYAFDGCESLQSIVIPESVTEIGDGAFMYCKSLQSIVIPNSVTEIGGMAFSCYDSLQNIVIPESVTKIGLGAFSGCTSLRSIVIPKSVTEIEDNPFPPKIEIISHSERFVIENDFFIDLKEKRLIQPLKDKKHIVIPDSVTEIGKFALGSCKSLQSIVIPKSVTEIGDKAFWGCESLESIVIPRANAPLLNHR